MEKELTIYEQFAEIANSTGVDAALEMLAKHYRDLDQPHQLFEVLKMQVRHQLGLPLLYGQQPDELDESTQKKLEDGLLAACRETGIRLIELGNYRQGWMYLQPVGDRNLVSQLFSKIDVNEENSEELIDVMFAQGAAPELGYSLLMQQYGTCNAITTFDTQIIHLEKPLRKKLAAQLVRHLYAELVENVKSHIAETEKKPPAEETLAELQSSRPWLTRDGGHHIDTTHLASVMRIGRDVDSKAELQMLVELARYGLALDKDFQYPGQPPFEDTYPDHLMFYQGLLGENVEASIKHFDTKAKTVSREEHGNVAVETFVDLLCRMNKRQRALDVAIESLLGQGESLGIAPGVFEIAGSNEEFQKLMEYYRGQDDLLGFAIGLLKSKMAK